MTLDEAASQILKMFDAHPSLGQIRDLIEELECAAYAEGFRAGAGAEAMQQAIASAVRDWTDNNDDLRDLDDVISETPLPEPPQ